MFRMEINMERVHNKKLQCKLCEYCHALDGCMNNHMELDHNILNIFDTAYLASFERNCVDLI